MKKDVAQQGGTRRIWWWLLLIAIVAGLLGYFLTAEVDHEQKERILSEKAPPGEGTPVPKIERPVPEDQKGLPPAVVKKAIPPVKAPEEDEASRIERELVEFFRYLDGKDYVRRLNQGKDTYTRFKEILRRLAAKPPVPAGEGVDPKSITANVYHLFRALTREDLRLIKAVMRNEADYMEAHLRLFHNWLMLDVDSSGTNFRPSSDISYRYAGFFLNTVGGRGYLFRRPTGFRLLLSFYCVQILHEAEKQGNNTYGIDMYPLIEPLMVDIRHYQDFRHNDEYVARLLDIKSYYKEKRSSANTPD
jgi:hypothetical protein